VVASSIVSESNHIYKCTVSGIETTKYHTEASPSRRIFFLTPFLGLVLACLFVVSMPETVAWWTWFDAEANEEAAAFC
jgi:hypothetical protein